MTLKEKLLQAIEALPSTRLAEALTFVKSLSTKPSTTSAKSFLAHLKTIGTWSGDDLQECLEAVQNSCGEAQFDYSPNPFD
ncbi:MULTISPECIES: hypothetical protein [unclassified Microcoleus]|jgi:hypothetical protein|uniref:hypothetical protein n=1 Tax=unclassified Microcoleus TaxID=2642155 RepID=UPI001DA43315|nr:MULTISPECIES: hypothetical protein [unclassified Microcoleus]MCC3420149.1 DUF2281 domain-containing protein [Microcoleus sp. PH2017_07_MST_O_A]MCC3466841.1 DUF2281 domain-containing protein [Microcoleus sp. PH2017_06_SFM_O_A]TAG63039.1 MAG: DUF2281 domain-containing protein [Oscillatoriales cyanobacterium]MCC3415027.1 DUF2281 domain-containing protein [Microcoleus sp. PH2017_02_FOX_O_A]MCC3519185.1 DUF2281 domain-containing protein [Microcoleus sp. PH2017_18_LLB_O_A]